MSNKITLDRIDRNILIEMQTNARITNKALAEKVGLSPSPCLQRVRRLEKLALIGPYHARIDLDQLCRYVEVMATVTLRDHDSSVFLTFEEIVGRIPEVTECVKLSGTFDYLVRFICADIQHYHTVSDDILQALSGKVHFASHVVLDRTKEPSGAPLETLLQ